MGEWTLWHCCISRKFRGYMYARQASVDVNISMDIHGYIHEYPRKICGYGYGHGWQISYPRQACIYGRSNFVTGQTRPVMTSQTSVL